MRILDFQNFDVICTTTKKRNYKKYKVNVLFQNLKSENDEIQFRKIKIKKIKSNELILKF